MGNQALHSSSRGRIIPYDQEGRVIEMNGISEYILKGLWVFPFLPVLALAESVYENAVFAGGCFWCMVESFEKLPGVKEVVAGYTGGIGKNPTYEDYAAKGHVEAVRVTYDPSIISYSELLDVFWRQIDPTDSSGQFCDRGPQYRPAIFYENERQKKLAEESREKIARSTRFAKPVKTEILKASVFHRAEDYHQDYYKKNPDKYRSYRLSCGRDNYLGQVWGNKRLTPLQRRVTQENGTEPPFRNEYWNNHAEGIYVDVASGEPLFSSRDKYDSQTGWPSFTRPLESGNIIEKREAGPLMRTEVRSKQADSHLGHVFKDGPAPTGLRYCINSAALRFIPKDELEKEGYGEFKGIFEKSKK